MRNLATYVDDEPAMLVPEARHREHRTYAAANEASGIGAQDHAAPALNAAAVRRHLVNDLRDRVLRAGEKLHEAGIRLGKAGHASTGADVAIAASEGDIAAARAFAAITVRAFSDLLSALDEHDVPVEYRRGADGS